mmetsp:Transcript_63403/g.149239  ORF Transcript_63403/g.149239 Transcript_63403/m.149239 type:complete len:251 (+) Transcript_63403:876-1628(+)
MSTTESPTPPNCIETSSISSSSALSGTCRCTSLISRHRVLPEMRHWYEMRSPPSVMIPFSPSRLMSMTTALAPTRTPSFSRLSASSQDSMRTSFGWTMTAYASPEGEPSCHTATLLPAVALMTWNSGRVSSCGRKLMKLEFIHRRISHTTCCASRSSSDVHNRSGKVRSAPRANGPLQAVNGRPSSSRYRMTKRLVTPPSSWWNAPNVDMSSSGSTCRMMSSNTFRSANWATWMVWAVRLTMLCIGMKSM